MDHKKLGLGSQHDPAEKPSKSMDYNCFSPTSSNEIKFWTLFIALVDVEELVH